MKFIGIIPDRMSVLMFHGKPVHDILGILILEYDYIRAKMYNKWNEFVVATCDKRIINFCRKKNSSHVLTKSSHVKTLDRFTEASNKIKTNILKQVKVNNCLE